jgi:hypothetical protein
MPPRNIPDSDPDSSRFALGNQQPSPEFVEFANLVGRLLAQRWHEHQVDVKSPSAQSAEAGDQEEAAQTPQI